MPCLQPTNADTAVPAGPAAGVLQDGVCAEPPVLLRVPGVPRCPQPAPSAAPEL